MRGPSSPRVTPRNAVWLQEICAVFFVNGTAEQMTNITKLRADQCEKTQFQGKSVSEINC